MTKRWIAVLAWVASVLILWAILGTQGLSQSRLVALGILSALALLAVVWAGRAPARSMSEMLNDIEAEQVPAVAGPRPVVRTAGLGAKGGGSR
jgi:hypothetical protein